MTPQEAQQVADMIKKNGIQIIDLKFNDLPGLWQHFSIPPRELQELDDIETSIWVDGIGGLWGGIGTGLFATAAIGGVDGVFHGEPSQMVDQLVGIGAVALYSFTVTSVILKVLDVTVGLRVHEEHEELGLDATQHGERGYALDEASGIPVVQYTETMAVSPSATTITESASSGA